MKSVCLFVLLLALVLVPDLSVVQGKCPPCCPPWCPGSNWKELSRRCRWTFRLDSERQFRAEIQHLMIIFLFYKLDFS